MRELCLSGVHLYRRSTSRTRWGLVAIVLLAISVAAGTALSQAALKIVVLEGEDGVNVINQKTAVAPLVEVRDENDLPVAGAVVTFAIAVATKDVATLNNALQQVQITTNALGRATVAVNPVSSGNFQIQISAAYRGQTVSMAITQNNFPTAQAALAAGKTPGASTGASSASSAGSTGSTAASSGASAGAGAGGAATGASTGAVAGSGAAAGGGLSATGIALTSAAVAGGVVATKAVVDATKGPSCSSEETALNNAGQTFSNDINTYVSCSNAARTSAQQNACDNQYLSAFQKFLNSASAYCSCVGPAASADISADDKAAVRELFNELRSIGLNPGTLPSCYQ